MDTDRIALLDQHTANQIAAGEVVERPSSVVKELVENAIDAGSTSIQIVLEEGGRKLIEVVDNGFGMSRNDLILALHRHATSKIRSAEDLFSLRTLGFRGEALPSIASVSRMSIQTRLTGFISGYSTMVIGGEIGDINEVGCLEGTRIRIEDLFFNTPARLNFLKSSAAELNRCLDIIGQLAIAYPSIRFLAKNGSNEIIRSDGSGEPLDAIAAFWGRGVAKKLFPIMNQNPEASVKGFVSSPDLTKAGRSHQLIYVNGRVIKSRLISHALEEAMRSLTPESRYPLAVVMIQVPPETVDVNVHPTKTEVKFRRDGEVHHAVSVAVKDALMSYGIVPLPRISVPELTLDTGTGSTQGTLDISRNVWTDPHPVSYPEQSAVSDATAIDSPLQSPALPRPFAELLREFRVLGQIGNTYIIADTQDGLAVIDQHVAHERVLYERLTVKRNLHGIAMQRLLTPITVELGRREALLLKDQCSSFASSGWEIEPFGSDSFMIRAVPALLAKKQVDRILKDMVDDLVNQTISRRLIVQHENVLITNACKMDVKAGDPLNIEEMQALLEQLAETENPYLCPHGRPIVVKLPISELEKQFKR